MTGIFSINCHMNDGSYAVAVRIRNAQLFHQLTVSRCNCLSIDLGNDAVTADFFEVRYTASVDFFSIGFLQTLTDGVGGCTFCESGVFQKKRVFQLIMMNTTDFEYTLG